MKYLLSMGSNHKSSSMMAKARKLLRDTWPSATFSRTIRTAPIGMDNPASFLNQLAHIECDESIAEMEQKLKDMEKALGRTQEQKNQGIILIDIDLLKADSLVIKKEDMERDYIVRLLK